MKLNYQIHNKKRNTYYSVAIPIGIFLIVWEIMLYRKTFIDLYILFSIIFGVGLLATFLDLKNYQKTYSYRGYKSFLFALGTNLCIWGFTACTVFMATNYYLGDSQTNLTTYQIVDRYSMTGSKNNRSKRTPAFKIKYDGKLKDIHFGHDYYENMNSFKYVELETRQGLWNFDILINKKLKK
mgnify:CR=1 FL=1